MFDCTAGEDRMRDTAGGSVGIDLGKKEGSDLSDFPAHHIVGLDGRSIMHREIRTVKNEFRTMKITSTQATSQCTETTRGQHNTAVSNIPLCALHRCSEH